MSVMGISTKNNPEQAELARLIMDRDHPIVICNGQAGTGKNFISLATALEIKRSKKGQLCNARIFYSRAPVEVGKSLGYLKGDLDKKFEPYTMPVSDTIENLVLLSEDKLNYNELMSKIECSPTSFMRGRSLNNCFLIVDECQNLSLTELQTLITRMGTYSKIILLGSFSQVDEKTQQKKNICDFEKATMALRDLPYVGFVELKQSMRSPWCAEIDALFDKLKQES